MDRIAFQVILDSLRCGQEIEFSYKGKQYSITNSNGYWIFAVIQTIRLSKEFVHLKIRKHL